MKIEVISPFGVFVTLDSEQLNKHFMSEVVAVVNKCCPIHLAWTNLNVLQIVFGPNKGLVRGSNHVSSRFIQFGLPTYDQDYLWTLLKDVPPVVKAHKLALEALQSELHNG